MTLVPPKTKCDWPGCTRTGPLMPVREDGFICGYLCKGHHQQLMMTLQSGWFREFLEFNHWRVRTIWTQRNTRKICGQGK